MKVIHIADKSLINWIDDVEIVHLIEHSDVVVFGGGPDVTPMFYGESRVHPFTKSHEGRDKCDMVLMEKAIKDKKLIVGICRSAQLLTAMAGGKVIQHVNKHVTAGLHEIKTKDGDEFRVTSTHHQMMYPYTAEKYEVLASSSEMLSDTYAKNDVQQYEMHEEPEVVWYPEIKGLAIQPHPETMIKDCNFHRWLNELIKKYVI